VIGHDVLSNWASPRAPARRAAELLFDQSGDGSLESTLTGITGRLGSAKFLVVNVNDIAVSTLGQAIDSFHRTGCGVRLCLAGSRQALMQVDALGLDNDRVGLMIDAVNAQSTWSDLIWDRLEAVRFNPEFVDCATRNMRFACVLESMLALAREVGLRTLGSYGAAQCASVSGQYDFDYLPTPVDSAPQSRISGSVPRSYRSGVAAIVDR